MSPTESRPPSALEEILSSAVDRQVSEQRALLATLEAIRSSIDSLRDSVAGADEAPDVVLGAVESLRADLLAAIPDPTQPVLEAVAGVRAELADLAKLAERPTGPDPDLLEAIESLRAEISRRTAETDPGLRAAIDSLRGDLREHQMPAGVANAISELKSYLPTTGVDPGLRQSVDLLRDALRAHRPDDAGAALEALRSELRELRDRRAEPDLTLRDSVESLRTRLPSDTAAELRHVLTDLRDSLRDEIATARPQTDDEGAAHTRAAVDETKAAVQETRTAVDGAVGALDATRSALEAIEARVGDVTREVRALRQAGEERPSDVLERAALVDRMEEMSSTLDGVRGEVTDLATAIVELNKGLQGWADRLQERVGSLAQTLLGGLDELATAQREALIDLGTAITRAGDALADRQEELADGQRAALAPIVDRLGGGVDPEHVAAVMRQTFGTLGDDLAAVRERLQEGEDLTKYLSDQVDDLDKVIGGLGEIPERLEAVIAQALRRASTLGAGLDKELEAALARSVGPLGDRIEEVAGVVEKLGGGEDDSPGLKRISLRLVELETRLGEVAEAISTALEEVADEQREHRAELADALTELAEVTSPGADVDVRRTSKQRAKPKPGSTRASTEKQPTKKKQPAKKQPSGKRSSRKKGSARVSKRSSGRRRPSDGDYIPL